MRSGGSSDEDARLWEWIRKHPSTATELTAFGLSYPAAKKWLKSNEVPSLGKLRFRSKGQPPELFGYGCKSDNLEHECILSKILLPYFLHGLRITRPGPKDSDAGMDADVHFAVEADRGSESHRRVIDHLGKFIGFDGFVLFVTTTRRRVDMLRESCGMFDDFLLLSTIDELRKDPLYGEVVQDVYGHRVSVLKPPRL